MIIDRDMILRVIMNLIENAIKHTPDGGRITIRATWQDDQLLVRVTDTGKGIPEHYLGEIFDKYFRIRHAGAPSGVGLGLAYCRLAVEAHGGRIWAESGTGGDDGRDGQGATFAFTLPRYTPQDDEDDTAGG
jgi:signal transduction histidine kinase